MTLTRTLSRSLAPLIDLVFPPRCPSCGGATAEQAGLCPECWSELVIPGDPACTLCQRPFASETLGEGAICGPCLAERPRHDGIAAGTLYNDASRKLVLALKHGNRIALAPMMARLAAARLPPMEDDCLVVPVPLHRWRIWRRGFNQAALLAREIAALRSLQLQVDGLVRRKSTPTLGGLGRKERSKVLTGAITANPAVEGRLKGRSIILVDDVLTSGATSNACVRALKTAGAGKVVICCFARVLDEALGARADTETPGTTRVPGAT